MRWPDILMQQLPASVSTQSRRLKTYWFLIISELWRHQVTMNVSFSARSAFPEADITGRSRLTDSKTTKIQHSELRGSTLQGTGCLVSSMFVLSRLKVVLLSHDVASILQWPARRAHPYIQLPCQMSHNPNSKLLFINSCIRCWMLNVVSCLPPFVGSYHLQHCIQCLKVRIGPILLCIHCNLWMDDN